MLPVGLEMWELVTVSALCSWAFLSVSSVIAMSFAVYMTRETAPAAAPAAQPAAAPAQRPQPVFGRPAAA